MTALFARARLTVSTSAMAVAALLLLPLTLPAGSANAASFDPFAEASLDFDSLTGVGLKLETLSQPTSSVSGNATSSGDAFVSDDGSSVEASGMGETFGPGAAENRQLAQSTLELTNTTALDLTVSFTFVFDLEASISVTDLADDTIVAEARAFLSGGGIDENFLASVSTLGGPENELVNDSIDLSLVLPADSSIELVLGASTFGEVSTAVVPLPPAAWLLLSGVVGLAAFRKKNPRG